SQRHLTKPGERRSLVRPRFGSVTAIRLGVVNRPRSLAAMSYTTPGIRNIALVGHSAAGKTTLFEALLHAGGVIQTPRSGDRGTTVSDYDAMEKERKQSLNTVIASIDRGDCHINLIDTPGAQDFRGPTLTALAAVETCAIVVNAHAGIEYGTQRMMHYAKERRL